MNTTPTPPVFSFRRMAGLDQVLLLTDEEWRQLDQLDPKLWMSLSCPTTGLEFDPETLALLDTDRDGRIRAVDILSAVDWLCRRVKQPSRLRERRQTLPLDNLRDDTPEGAELLAAARLVQEKTSSDGGDAATDHVTHAQVTAALAAAADYPFNGDGVVPPSSAALLPEQDSPADTARFITLALAVVGGLRDDTGLPGLNADLAAHFRQRLEEVRQWRALVRGTDLPLGAETSAAWTLMQRLAPKIDDYFTRCRMAAFAPQALAALNEEDELSAAAGTDQGHGELYSLEALARRPLARIAADRPLDLRHGVNPAWEADLRAFAKLFASLLTQSPRQNGEEGPSLSEETWRTLKEHFAPYAAVLAQKPQFQRAPQDAQRADFPDLPSLAAAPGGDLWADDALGRAFLPLNPEDTLDTLTDDELNVLLSPAVAQGFAACTALDLAAPRMDSLRSLKKLILLYSHLYTLLMNFVSFADFYDPDGRAIFQAGTLYIDSRSCALCVPVADVDAHMALAAQSQLCLLYCQCVRKNAHGEDQTNTIAAALTAGTADALVKGRHGVFVDNAGQVWDCTLLRLVHNPISLREAMWAPYVRFANLVGEQLRKMVAARENAISEASAKTAGSLGQPPKAESPPADKAAPPKPPFDIAKSAGIFAAVSVGISMVSASFTYIAKSLFALGWWWPVAVVGLMACISGPSMLLAWFKLRRRSLGPLLDASGWAVNTGAPINLTMGAALTSVSQMPPGAKRSLDDPYGLPARLGQGKARRATYIVVLLLALLVSGLTASWVWREHVPTWLGSCLPWTRTAEQEGVKDAEKAKDAQQPAGAGQEAAKGAPAGTDKPAAAQAGQAPQKAGENPQEGAPAKAAEPAPADPAKQLFGLPGATPPAGAQ